MIEAQNVTVRFGRHKALDGVSLSARRGELVGVVGRAGSGKSVLLKTLCLLNRPEAGEVLLEGRALGRLGRAQLAEVRARFGFCFQNLALFDRLDAVSNVAYVLGRRGVAPAEANRRAQEQLKVVGLSGAEQRRPHELSGGMRRRLALARAMVSRPDVALFDDPFTGLDPVACARIARLIQDAHQVDGGVTVVASGDPGPLRAICDRLVLLVEGRVAADLSPSDFMSSTDARVRRYLGEASAE